MIKFCVFEGIGWSSDGIELDRTPREMGINENLISMKTVRSYRSLIKNHFVCDMYARSDQIELRSLLVISANQLTNSLKWPNTNSNYMQKEHDRHKH